MADPYPYPERIILQGIGEGFIHLGEGKLIVYHIGEREIGVMALDEFNSGDKIFPIVIV
jgi:hypothetical protein